MKSLDGMSILITGGGFDFVGSTSTNRDPGTALYTMPCRTKPNARAAAGDQNRHAV